jgi:fructose-bisphosphate aldolase class II
MTFGTALRNALAADSTIFDRIGILKQVEPPIEAAARNVLSALKFQRSQTR